MRLLAARQPDLQVWEYGARLTTFLQDRGASVSSQDELRAHSAKIATPDDINALDEELLRWWGQARMRGSAVIDSHAVTKEDYGFRVTAFSIEQFQQLAPDEIWLFYTAPEVALERISRAPGGRPMISVEEARMHTAAQASVASTFAIASGCPLYMFDTDTDQDSLVDRLICRLTK